MTCNCVVIIGVVVSVRRCGWGSRTRTQRVPLPLLPHAPLVHRKRLTRRKIPAAVSLTWFDEALRCQWLRRCRLRSIKNMLWRHSCHRCETRPKKFARTKRRVAEVVTQTLAHFTIITYQNQNHHFLLLSSKYFPWLLTNLQIQGMWWSDLLCRDQLLASTKLQWMRKKTV